MNVYTIHYTTVTVKSCGLGTLTNLQHHYDIVLAENADIALLHFDSMHKEYMDCIKSVDIIGELAVDYGG